MARRIYTGNDGLHRDLQATGPGAEAPIKHGQVVSVGTALRNYELKKKRDNPTFNRPSRAPVKEHQIMDREFQAKLEERLKEFREMTGRDPRVIYLGSDQWKLFLGTDASVKWNNGARWHDCEVVRVDLGFHIGVGI